MTIPPIISVDDHVVESPEMFKRWLPAQFQDRAPRVERLPWEMIPGNRQAFRPANSGPTADFWLFEDLWQGIPRGMASVGMDTEEITRVPMTYEEMRPGCYDPKARLADLDLVGIERSLCFPNQVRFCGQVFLWMNDKDLALACVKAYNDWIVEEWCGDSGGRLLPVCLIPLWDPIAAAAEVRRNAARGVRAVAFSELPAQLGLPSIYDKDGHWLPLFDACDETGTVVCSHIGSSSTIATTSADAPFGVAQALSTINSQLALADWLMSGLFARYDNLKLALSESQIGWMPFMFERVDRIWRQGNPMAELPAVLKEAPSTYADGHLFGCFFEDTFGLEVRDKIGVDSITFECDYPHQDSTWPNTQDYAASIMAGLDDETVYKIARGNAIRMLGLPETLPS
ncbi:MAG TPA: amidohydrolase family protein [Jatrophihabitantaceae bacterium]|nr:amidohydrolase family protein [Jatrophihabitantaceae bacterium]